MSQKTPYLRLLDSLSFLPIRVLRASLKNVPPEKAIRFGAWCGRQIAAFGGGGSEVARINLRLAFPEKDEVERNRLLIQIYENMGRVVTELALLQGRQRERLLQGVDVIGHENLAAAESASPTCAVMVITGHFGSWDLCAAALAEQGHRLTVVHRGFSNPAIEEMFSRIRRGESGDLEELKMGRRAVTGILRALRQGRKLVILGDQNAKADEGLFVPFFGHLACTRSAPMLIAMRRQIPVLPAFVYREGETSRHVVHLLPHLSLLNSSLEPDESLEMNVAQMTQQIEAAVRQAPDHWLWLHRRWRTRPARECEPSLEEGFYPPRKKGLWHGVRRAFRGR